jgi:hypothetical protein
MHNPSKIWILILLLDTFLTIKGIKLLNLFRKQKKMEEKVKKGQLSNFWAPKKKSFSSLDLIKNYRLWFL